jgi:hypothetical protein
MRQASTWGGGGDVQDVMKGWWTAGSQDSKQTADLACPQKPPCTARPRVTMYLFTQLATAQCRGVSSSPQSGQLASQPDSLLAVVATRVHGGHDPEAGGGHHDLGALTPPLSQGQGATRLQDTASREGKRRYTRRGRA